MLHQSSVISADDESGRTTLSNPAVRLSVPESAYVVLRRGDVEALVVDHWAVNDEVVRGHRAGYGGLAVLRLARRRDDLFVPGYAGLNFDHIHDGTRTEVTRVIESSYRRGIADTKGGAARVAIAPGVEVAGSWATRNVAMPVVIPPG